MRTFISIHVPEDVKREIRKIQDQLPEFKGKKTEPENLHLTLKFLGEVDEAKIEKIKEKLKTIEFGKFETEIDLIGVFDNRTSKIYSKKLIIWLHLANCEKLQKEIDQKLEGLFEKEKRFMGHLTIARIKEVENKKEFLEELGKIEIPKIKFNVEEFYLMKSELTAKGPEYSVLESYELN